LSGRKVASNAGARFEPIDKLDPAPHPKVSRWNATECIALAAFAGFGPRRPIWREALVAFQCRTGPSRKNSCGLAHAVHRFLSTTTSARHSYTRATEFSPSGSSGRISVRFVRPPDRPRLRKAALPSRILLLRFQMDGPETKRVRQDSLPQPSSDVKIVSSMFSFPFLILSSA